MTSRSSEERPLVCAGCGATYPADERFCPRCGLPLTYDLEFDEVDPLTARQERARKIKPQLSEGELVKVAGARNQAEAEFLQGLLLEEGVPSALRRARGFDVPDLLAAGPRDVLVPASGVDVARDVLLQAQLDPLVAGTREATGGDPPWRVLLWLVAAVAVVGALALIVAAGGR